MILLPPILFLSLVQNGLSTLFETTATVTEHSGKPPIIFLYKNVPPPLPLVSAPYTSGPVHDRQELFGARPLMFHNKPTYVPVIHPVYTIKSTLPSGSSSFQLDHQKRNYLQQLDYLNRHPSPVISSNEHFRSSPVDFGFQPLIKPSLPITTSVSSGYNSPPSTIIHHHHGLDSPLVTPQPYGYVRSYVDLLKKRQKQHFANQDPDLGGNDYGTLNSYRDVGSGGEEDDDDVSVHEGGVSGGHSGSGETDNNSVQQHENIEHSGEVGYFKQREHEIGKQKFSNNKKTSKNKVESGEMYNGNSDNDNLRGHTPKLYKVTEDFEDPGESDIESNEPNSGDDDDDRNSFNPHYNRYQHNDDSYEQDDAQEDDEDEEESKQHTRVSQPIQVYSQVRHVEKKNRRPLKPPVYEPNLRERLSQEKRHLVYKEEGYEDKEYDHEGEQRNSENTEEKGVKKGKRKRKKRLRKGQQQNHGERTRRDIHEPEALPLQGRPFRGNKKYGTHTNTNLTGIALINHINELIENTSVYIPDDESGKTKSGQQDLITSGSEIERPFVSVFKPASPEEIVNRYFKEVNPGRPAKSLYSTKPPIRCDVDDIDLDEEGFDGTKKKRGGRLGDKLDCLKTKHFGSDPFHSSFFKGELGKTGTLSLKNKLDADKRNSANVSKTVYDDVMNIIKNSQSSIVTTSPRSVRTTERTRLKAFTIRRPQTSYLEDTSSEENIYSSSLLKPTSVSLTSIPSLEKEKRKPNFSIFDINQFYPSNIKATIETSTPKTSPYKYYSETTPISSYSFTTQPTLLPPPIPFRSVHHSLNKHPTTSGRHPNLILHKQPNQDQTSLQSTQIKSHLHTNVLRPVFRPYQGGPGPGQRIVVHRVHF